MGDPAPRFATAADLAALNSRKPYHEVVAGQVVRKASPRIKHGRAQRKLSSLIDPFDGLSGDEGPGGWWIATEVEVEFEAHEVYLPDVAGWRRERMPELPDETPITLRPDWVCEILSPSSRRRDTHDKLQTYRTSGVPHYWIVDPEAQVLLVYRNAGEAFSLVLSAAAEDTVRAEPFGEIDLFVGSLFGLEAEPEP